MANDLPDAPWAGGGDELPDAPWADEHKPLSWSDVPSQMAKNFIPSAKQFGSDMAQPFIHPIETAKNIGNLGAGVVEKAAHAASNLSPVASSIPIAGAIAGPAVSILGAVSPYLGNEHEKYADAVGRFFADRYGGIENFKKTMAEDPVGFAGDLSTLFTGGETALARAPGALGKVGEAAGTAGRVLDPLNAVTGYGMIPKLAGKMGIGALGVTTGVGHDALQTAYSAGREGGPAAEAFRDNITRRAPLTEAVDDARGAIEALRTQRGNEYRQAMTKTGKIGADTTVLNFNKIDHAVSQADEIQVYRGRSGMQPAQTLNTPTDAVRTEMKGQINKWRALDPQEFHTAEGVDALKRSLYNIMDAQPYGSPQRKAASQIYGAVRQTIIDQVPEYAKVMKAYERASDQLSNIERELSLNPKANISTSLRKLQSVLRDNVNTSYGQRQNLVKFLVNNGAPHLMEKLAGQSLASWFPRGLARIAATETVPAMGAALAAGLPGAAIGAAATLPAISPRLMGEGAYWSGAAARKLAPITHVPRITRTLGVLGRAGAQVKNADTAATYVNLTTPFAVARNEQMDGHAHGGSVRDDPYAHLPHFDEGGEAMGGGEGPEGGGGYGGDMGLGELGMGTGASIGDFGENSVAGGGFSGYGGAGIGDSQSGASGGFGAGFDFGTGGGGQDAGPSDMDFGAPGSAPSGALSSTDGGYDFGGLLAGLLGIGSAQAASPGVTMSDVIGGGIGRGGGLGPSSAFDLNNIGGIPGFNPSLSGIANSNTGVQGYDSGIPGLNASASGYGGNAGFNAGLFSELAPAAATGMDLGNPTGFGFDTGTSGSPMGQNPEDPGVDPFAGSGSTMSAGLDPGTVASAMSGTDLGTSALSNGLANASNVETAPDGSISVETPELAGGFVGTDGGTIGNTAVADGAMSKGDFLGAGPSEDAQLAAFNEQDSQSDPMGPSPATIAQAALDGPGLSHDYGTQGPTEHFGGGRGATQVEIPASHFEESPPAAPPAAPPAEAPVEMQPGLVEDPSPEPSTPGLPSSGGNPNDNGGLNPMGEGVGEFAGLNGEGGAGGSSSVNTTGINNLSAVTGLPPADVNAVLDGYGSPEQVAKLVKGAAQLQASGAATPQETIAFVQALQARYASGQQFAWNTPPQWQRAPTWQRGGRVPPRVNAAYLAHRFGQVDKRQRVN